MSMKYCIACRKEQPDEYEFCPGCGGVLSEYSTKDDGSLSVGNENVIAGDIIKNKEEYHVNGNATVVRWSDPSKEVQTCHICGKNLTASEGYTCPVCGNYTCENDYVVELRRCERCANELDTNSTPATLTFSEEQLIKMDYEKILWDRIDNQLGERIENIYQRKSSNPYVKEAYLEYLLDINPLKVIEMPLAIASKEETDVLYLMIEAYVRLRRYASAEELIDRLIQEKRTSSTFLSLRKAEIYTDMFLAGGDEELLTRARQILSSAEDEKWRKYRWFVQSYVDWTVEGSHIKELMERIVTEGFEDLLAFRRKRKTLIAFGTVNGRLSSGKFVDVKSDREYPLLLSVNIGREYSFLSDIIGDDATVSRNHARVTVGPDLSVYIHDAGSSNGTLLDGERLVPHKDVKLSEGSVLQIGEHKFIYKER